MKTLKIFLAGLFLMTLSSKAQVNVNVNIGAPAWGPVGYTEVRYYYLPDIDMYYDIPTAMFIYFDGGGWVRTTYLPRRYRHYDLYGAYKVCLNDYGPNPYIYYKQHKMKYYHGYRGPVQRTIGTRPVYANNGPGGYYRDRDDYDRDNDRGGYYRRERERDDYNRKGRGNEDFRSDFRQDQGNGNGRGHEPGHGNGNGHGRGKRG